MQKFEDNSFKAFLFELWVNIKDIFKSKSALTSDIERYYAELQEDIDSRYPEEERKEPSTESYVNDGMFIETYLPSVIICKESILELIKNDIKDLQNVNIGSFQRDVGKNVVFQIERFMRQEDRTKMEEHYVPVYTAMIYHENQLLYAKQFLDDPEHTAEEKILQDLDILFIPKRENIFTASEQEHNGDEKSELDKPMVKDAIVDARGNVLSSEDIDDLLEIVK